jgi:hypothetical protein
MTLKTKKGFDTPKVLRFHKCLVKVYQRPKATTETNNSALYREHKESKSFEDVLVKVPTIEF